MKATLVERIDRAVRTLDSAGHGGTASLLAEARQEIDRLVEWKSSVLSALKTFPEFQAGEWVGDKEGWGFCFELIRWAQRESAQHEADDQLLRSELDSAGAPACEGQSVTARVRWLLDELERLSVRWRKLTHYLGGNVVQVDGRTFFGVNLPNIPRAVHRNTVAEFIATLDAAEDPERKAVQA